MRRNRVACSLVFTSKKSLTNSGWPMGTKHSQALLVEWPLSTRLRRASPDVPRGPISPECTHQRCVQRKLCSSKQGKPSATTSRRLPSRPRRCSRSRSRTVVLVVTRSPASPDPRQHALQKANPSRPELLPTRQVREVRGKPRRPRSKTLKC